MDGIKEFCELHGYDEREVRDVIESYFRACRRMISVYFEEFRIPYIGSFSYMHLDSVMEHVRRIRPIIEGEGIIDYDELVRYVKERIEKARAAREKSIGRYKVKYGDDFDLDKYDGLRNSRAGRRVARLMNDRKSDCDNMRLYRYRKSKKDKDENK